MSIFEDDTINDDFEVEIIDLPASGDESRISAAIAVLRSRISLSPRSEEPGDEVANDEFEVEITDLPTSDDEDSMISEGLGKVRGGEEDFVPAHGLKRQKSTSDLLITNLGSLHLPLPRKVHMLRLATVGIAILIMLGVVWESVPSAHEAVLGLFPRPTPTPTPVTREFGRFGSSFSVMVVSGGDITISSTPIAGATVIPWNPNTPVANVLGSAPADCPFSDVPQDPNSTDFTYGSRVGELPLWVMGFRGVPARLIGFTRANPPQYGWVHQVTVLLEDNTAGPVMLQGEHLKDGTPLLFSDSDSGQSPTTFLTLRLDNASNPNPEGTVRAGIQSISLYIPTAGCYSLKASWAGGSWEVIFAAGE